MGANPLLDWLNAALPPFDRIDAARDGLAALEKALTLADAALDAAEAKPPSDWASCMAAVELAEERIDRAWHPVRLLAAVADAPALRKVHEEGEAMLAAWHARALQRSKLMERLKQLDEKALSPSQQEARRKRLRAMRRAGAMLDAAGKQRIAAIEQRLATLAARFEQNLLDAERSFRLLITDKAQLAGLPETLREIAKARAEEEGEKGWLFDASPSLAAPLLAHAEDRALRQRMHRAYRRRASEAPYDNTPLMLEILSLRYELARLLGYEDYAAYALDGRMCASVQELKSFLHALIERVRPRAEEELAMLEDFARKRLRLDRLQPEDLAYASEQLRKHALQIDDEALRPFFPCRHVLQAALSIAEETFQIAFVEDEGAPRWHRDVLVFRVCDARTNAAIGWLYFDLAARANKRSGAWMDDFLVRWRRPDGRRQLPVACIVADFAAPKLQGDWLWTHDDVCTLLHELGHALHHLLAEVEDARDVAGLGGVEWDAVELPSQWFEQYAWTREGLRRLSCQIETKTPLSDEMIERIQHRRRLLAALRLARQLELSLLDLALHEGKPPADLDELRARVNEARHRAGVVPRADDDRLENSFAHIFAGGYAAGYYGYLWAEALAAEAWQRTHPDGHIDRASCKRFRQEILAPGGARPMRDSFAAFAGHPHPSPQALLALYGLSGAPSDE